MDTETAREMIRSERLRDPAVVELARSVSLGVRVELELMRAIRLALMPGTEPGIEADLFYSPLVVARDANAIVLQAEVRRLLRQELANHREDLDRLQEILEASREGMDAVILLEELATAHALAGDRESYGAMQGQLGVLVRALSEPTPDPALERWAATALDRLPERAVESQAGRALRARIGRGENLPPIDRDAETVEVHASAFGNSLLLSARALPNSVALPVPGPLPATVEVGWPTPGGWSTALASLPAEAGESVRVEVPHGLLRLRGMDGHDLKLRVSGPFEDLRPKLLSLPGPHLGADRSGVAKTVDDLAWDILHAWLSGNPEDDVVIVPVGLPYLERLQEVQRQLEAEGFRTWSPVSGTQDTDALRANLDGSVREAGFVLVVMGNDAQSEADFLHLQELWNAMKPREQTLSPLDLHLLLPRSFDADETPLQDVLLDWNLVLGTASTHTSATSASAAILESRERRARDTGGAAACVFRFPGTYDLSRYLDHLRNSSQSSTRPSRLDVVAESLLPVAVSVDDTVAVFPEDDAIAVTEELGTEARFRRESLESWLDELAHDLSGVGSFSGRDGNSVLREFLIRAEQRAIAAWLPSLAAQNRRSATPANAMVMIQWDRWWRDGANLPQSFNEYWSRQRRLANVLADGGTLWVVTGRTGADTQRHYRLAYRLDNVRVSETRDEDGPRFHVKADWEDVTEFEDHTANQELLSLAFATGKPLVVASDIGRRLQSIPLLTDADVSTVNALAREFGRPADDMEPRTEAAEPVAASERPALTPGAEFEAAASDVIGRLGQFSKWLGDVQLPVEERLFEAVQLLVEAEDRAARVIYAARGMLLEEHGSFDEAEAIGIIEELGGIARSLELTVADWDVLASQSILQRTQLRSVMEQHARFAVQKLRYANQPLRLAMGRSISALQDANQTLEWLVRIPLIHDANAGSDIQAFSSVISEKLRSLYLPRVELVDAADEKSMSVAVQNADLILIHVTDALLERSEAHWWWRDILAQRVGGSDAQVLMLADGGAERIERLYFGSEPWQAVVDLDKVPSIKSPDAATALGQLIEPYVDERLRFLFDPEAVQQVLEVSFVGAQV